MRHPLIAATAAAGLVPAALVATTMVQPEVVVVSPAMKAAVADTRRKPESFVRDKYRHPAETLSFFSVTPTKTVVEVLPSGGWYSEILAPFLAARGHYVASVPNGKGRDNFDKYVAADPARFGKVTVVPFAPLSGSIAPAGSADVVLTFRNVHNLLMGDPALAPAAFAAFYKALKPGGILGVVDHRLPESSPAALEKTSGYVKRSTIVKLAIDAGFKIAGESEINANPKDKAIYPDGVWTLPPTYALKDKDRARYAAIGESDRLTIKFVKLAQ